MLEGRMINVELTAGGGGNSGLRLEKVRERNKALLGQRVRILSSYLTRQKLIRFYLFRKTA